jgi:hypothetical protein
MVPTRNSSCTNCTIRYTAECMRNKNLSVCTHDHIAALLSELVSWHTLVDIWYFYYRGVFRIFRSNVHTNVAALGCDLGIVATWTS